MHQFGLVVVADREFSVVGHVAGSVHLCTRNAGTGATTAVDKIAKINVLVFFRVSNYMRQLSKRHLFCVQN